MDVAKASKLGILLLWSLFACRLAEPDPTVARPENPAQLEPPVAELLERLASQAEANPRNGKAHGELGLAYEANMLWAEARDCFSTAAQLDPEQMLWRLHLAIAARQAGDFDGSLRILQDTAAAHQDSAPLLHRLGQALLESGDLAGAESAFRRLVEIAPQSAPAQAGLGDVLLQERQDGLALQALRKAVSLDPGYRSARYLLGRAYRRAGREEEARRELAIGANSSVRQLPDAFSRRIEEYALNSTMLLRRAAELHHSGNTAPAVEILEKLVGFQPGNVSALNNLAVGRMRLGRLEDAAKALEKARKADPEKFSTYLNLALLARRQGDFGLALQHSAAAVGRAPGMSQAHYSQAQSLADLGRLDEAFESLEESLMIDARKAGPHTFAGDLCLALQRLEEAVGHYRDALQLNSRFLPAQVGLARASLALGRSEEAEKAVAAIRAQAPNHPLLPRLESSLRTRR